MRIRPKTLGVTLELPEWLSFESHLVSKGTAEIRETDPAWTFGSAPWRQDCIFANDSFEHLWLEIHALRNGQSKCDHERGRKVLVWHTRQFDVESFKKYAKEHQVSKVGFVTIWSIK